MNGVTRISCTWMGMRASVTTCQKLWSTASMKGWRAHIQALRPPGSWPSGQPWKLYTTTSTAGSRVSKRMLLMSTMSPTVGAAFSGST